jgi:hypothetical protein
MRSSVIAAFALAGIAMSGETALAQKGPRFGKQGGFGSGWLASLSAGQQQARQAGKPLMVVVRCVP